MESQRMSPPTTEAQFPSRKVCTSTLFYCQYWHHKDWVIVRLMLSHPPIWPRSQALIHLFIAVQAMVRAWKRGYY